MEVEHHSRRSEDGADALVAYVVGLATLEQRRAATSIPKRELFGQVQLLSNCQRCGFVDHVLAAFDPDALEALGSAGALSAGAGAALGEQGGDSGGPIFPSARLLALLTSGGGAEDLVGLLQFNWKGVSAGGGTGASGGHEGAAAPSPRGPAAGAASGGAGASSGGSGGSGGGPCVTLSDTLLSKPRLLQRFLTESVGVLQALHEDVGDCRRHAGYPGPLELASTLGRLDTQRCHTLERLAAWGVLRRPAQQAQQGHGNLECGQPEHGQHSAAQEQQRGEGQPARRAANRPAAPGAGPLPPTSPTAVTPGASGPGVLPSGAASPVDRDLALAIQLSLQRSSTPSPAGGNPPERAATPGTASNARVARVAGGAPGATCSSSGNSNTPQAAAAAPRTPDVGQGGDAGSGGGVGGGGGSPRTPGGQPAGRRPQRTPPRPTGVGGGAGAGGAGGGGASSSGRRSGGTPGRSCEQGRDSGVCSPSGQGLSTWPGGRGEAAGPLPPGWQQAGSAGGVSSSLEGLAACGLAEAAGGAPLPAALTQPPQPYEPGDRPGPGAEEGGVGPGVRGGRGPALSVAEVLGAAAALPDASLLVDTAAVAALPEGLRERVQQLVAQLVQVQQRRGRLEAAAHHGVVAAGRKLLLLLLHALWGSLRRHHAHHAGSAAARGDGDGAVRGGAGAGEGAAAAAAAAAAAGSPPHPGAVGHAARRSLSTSLTAAAAAAAGGGAAPAAAGGGAAGRAADASSSAAPAARSLAQRPAAASSARGAHTAGEETGQGGQDDGVGGWYGRRSTTGRRRARYGGVLARLAEGLGLEDTTFEEGLSDLSDLTDLSSPSGEHPPDAEVGAEEQLQGAQGAREGPGVERGSAAGLRAEPGASRQQQQPARQAGATAPRVQLQRASSALPLAAASNTGPVDRAALPMRSSLSASLPHGSFPVGSAAAATSSSSTSTVATTTASLAGARSAGADAAEVGLPHRLEARDDAPRAHVRDAARDAARDAPRDAPRSETTCSSGCPAAAADPAAGAGSCGRQDCRTRRVLQAQQLRNLQAQLLRCQEAQSEVQGEVGELLDALAEARRSNEQAQSTLRRELALWQGHSAALAVLGSEELGALAAKLEGALGRVRAAQLQAASERDLLCPVCWEGRKGLVFNCGHQTCCGCGERLSACPICRGPISIRIKVYG